MSPEALRTNSEGKPGEHRCLGCGSFVSARFARVFGDNENRVEACLDCTQNERVEAYNDAAGSADLPGP